MKKVKKSLNKLITGLISYIYTNRLFLSYLVISVIGTIILRYYTVKGDYFFGSLITNIGIILLVGAFGYLIKPKNQFKYFFIWIIFFTALEVINSIYYMFYTNFASLAEISSVSQLETVSDSVITQLRLIDFIYVLQPIIFYYIHKHLKTSPYYNLIGKVENKKNMVIATLISAGVFLIFTFATATGTDYSRLSKQWDRPYIVERFGILMYQANDVFQTIQPRINSLFGQEEAMQMVDDYFNDDSKEKYNETNKYSNILKGMNVIYIHMESMQNFLMDLEFNGEKVTPNLQQIADEGMFFSNFYPQVSIGTSSDAEYITQTGLLPSLNGTVFVNYSNNTFNTLVGKLKDEGYYTFSMHGNLPAMWNRSKVHPKFGYTDMIYKESFTFNDDSKDPNNTDWIGLGINDKLFFEQGVQKLIDIENTHQNYFGTIITLSNHSPFAPNQAFTLDLTDYYTDEVTGEEKSSCYLCERDVGKYIVSSHYADEALGDFMRYIKESDNFNNTLFVFYGDHDAKMNYKDMNYLYNYDYLTGELKEETDPTYVTYDSFDHQLNKKTPLIFWTKNKKLAKKLHGEVKTMMGMYDLAPTLYNMLGIKENYVLGHDIFNVKDNNIIVFPSGNFLTNKVYYNNSKEEYKMLDDDTVFKSSDENPDLEQNYINERLEYSEKALEIGNALITYDLFKNRVKEE